MASLLFRIVILTLRFRRHYGLSTGLRCIGGTYNSRTIIVIMFMTQIYSKTSFANYQLPFRLLLRIGCGMSFATG